MQHRQKAISEIISLVAKTKKKEQKIAILRENDSETLRYILELTFHPNVAWWIPEGTPPYKKSDLLDLEGRLYGEARIIPLFLYSNRPEIKKFQRENLFINLLESIHPNDAELLIAVKDKKVDGLDIEVINEAFPGLIPYEQIDQA